MSETQNTDVAPEIIVEQPDSFARQMAKSFSINAAGSAGMLVGLGVAAVLVDKFRARRKTSSDSDAGSTETNPTEA